MTDGAINHVRSRDGTYIAYRQAGEGPGLVLLHGAMQSSANFSRLCEALADRHTVYVPDRRGRGGSGAAGSNYGIAREVEDLSAVLAATGARDVFALSSGAIVTLWTALGNPAIGRMAIYEPPLPLGTPSPLDWVPRYERELGTGKLGAAMVSAMKGTADRHDWFTHLPRPLLRALMGTALSSGSGEGKAIKALIPTVHCDNQLVAASAGQVGRFAVVSAQVLLVGGDNSNLYLDMALDALQQVLPQAGRVTLRGIGHMAADNTGKPEELAGVLRRFFV